MIKKCKRSLSLILILTLIFSMVNFQSFATDDDYHLKGESFEGANIPAGWSTLNGGTMELSANHYKHGSNALKWNFISDSKLRVNQLLNLTEAGTYNKGGMKIWLYNENPINEVVTFKYGLESQLDNNNPHYQFDVLINFQGWRAIWIKFKQEGDNPSYIGAADEALEMMEIEAPSQDGSLFIDMVEFSNDMDRSRSADYQMPKIGIDDVENASYWDKAYYYSQLTPSLPEESTITQQQIGDFDRIENRYENWVYGEYLDLTKEPLSIRNTALQTFISEGLAAYNDLNIVKHADGRITGTPLFSAHDPQLPKFGNDVSKAVLLPLVFDYKVNGNTASKEKFFDVVDYMHDQGWAEGSGLGTMDHEANKHNGYFHSIYLMKDELQQTGRLEREKGTFYWNTLFGKTFESIQECTADEIRTKFIYNLLYVLLMEDSPEKVRYMKGLLQYFNDSLRIAPGYADLIKPDYSLFHHRGTYLSAYGPDAMHMAALIAYLLNDTSFALSTESTNNIKNSLLNARIYSNLYSMPLGVGGRLPHRSGALSKIVPAYAYMALASDPVDTEMVSAFMRLWEPQSTYLKEELFPKADSYSVSYLHTMGGLQLAVDLAEAGHQIENSPNGTWIYPYSALAINRGNDWMVSVKGFGQYVWDYESASNFNNQTLTWSKQNVFGRYQSYGSMQINGTGSPEGTIESGYNIENGWDWNRWPGATTTHLSLADLEHTGKGDDHRLFSDQTFVGGIMSKEDYGMFAMKLHDNYSSNIRVNKSVFFFGDKIVCLGSDIEADDTQNNTETTLFQSYMSDSAMPFWFDSTQAITSENYSNQITTSQAIWMIDPYNNGYYLPNANGLMLQRGLQTSRSSNDSMDTAGNYTAAWIDHGVAPAGEGYEYAVKVATTPQDMEAFANNPGYQVLQRDQNAHVVKNTDQVSNITGYAVMNQSATIDHGYLQSVSVPCMVMTKEVSDSEIILSMSDPDLRLPKVMEQRDITDDILMVESEMNTAYLTLKGSWSLKNPSSEARVIAVNNLTTILAFDCVDGKTIDVELVKDAIVLEADAYVRGGSYADTNYGTESNLFIKDGGSDDKLREGYMKFDLSCMNHMTPQTVTLNLYANDVTNPVTITIYSVSDDSWTETGINWNNKPVGVTEIATVMVDIADKWYSFDITSFVNSELNGDKVVSLYIKDDSGAKQTVKFDSKESANVPKLEVSMESIPTPAPVSIQPIGDAYVNGGSKADTNYGTANLTIKTGGSESTTRESYIKFDLNGVSPNAESAVLKLYASNVGGSVPITVYSVSDDSWTEDGLTWNNKPLGVTELGTITVDTVDSWYTLDITSFVNGEMAGDKIVSLYLKDDTGASTTIKFESREDANGPLLGITY